MHRSFVLALCLIVLALPAAATTTSYIVELNEDPAAVAAEKSARAGNPWSSSDIAAYRAKLRASQDQFLTELAAKGVPFTVKSQTVANVAVQFRYTLVYNGVTLVTSPASVAAIQAMPQVKKVHEDKIVQPSLDHSVEYIRAPQVYGAVKELTQFDDFREGYEGQGVYVSIIDTGISWSHPMFGGDPTPPRLGVEPAASNRNQKVVYYLPLHEDLEDGSGHGTHVASTAAGYLGHAPGDDGLPLTGDDVPMHGVAPQAKIMAYKVCSDAVSASTVVGGCFQSSIVLGIEDSASPVTVTGFPKPVAHVINMSLGGGGNPDDPYGVASDNVTRLGVTVVAAAGNDGEDGDNTVSSPCVGRRVICVANSLDRFGSWSFDVLDPTAVSPVTVGSVTPANQLASVGSPAPLIAMGGSALPPANAMAQYLVWVQGGETLASYPANVRGRIALVDTDLPSAFGQIAANATAAGAVAVILNNPTANPTAVKTTIPSANIRPEHFATLKSLFDVAPGATLASGAMSRTAIRINRYFDTPTISASSSRGPVTGLGQIKPDLAAPGTFILAATGPASEIGALSQSNYASISGTSMASPHVAGAAALVKQAHPTWTPDMIRTVLQNTSTNLRNPAGVPNADGGVERVLDQGAGLIDVYEAVNAKALMGVPSDKLNEPSILGSHSFGEVAAINSRTIISRSVTITLRDLSGSAATYNLSAANNRGLDLPGVTVTITPSTVSVPANGSTTATVTISIDGSRFTTGRMYELQWYVRALRADGGELLSMPFYLRAVRQSPAAAVMNPIADDSPADQLDGVDRDGSYVISWTYPSTEPARPCAYRIDEAQSSGMGTLWYDNGEELMSNTGNSKWAASLWTTRPFLNNGSLGYAAAYIDEQTMTLTMKESVILPNSMALLTFESDEDLEPGFDYGYIDVSTDEGASWDTIRTFNGFFSGERAINLTDFAGQSIRIRFRVVTDELVSTPVHLGWSLDEIRIQAGAPFATIATVSADSSSYTVSNKADGTWAHRVVAMFDCGAESFGTTPSNVETITVSNGTAPPTASFTASTNPSNAAQAVTFDASASTDNDTVNGTGIVRYDWSFGDGTTASTTAATVTHTYATAGTYRVSLTVTDDDEESAQSESLQTVRDANATISGGGWIPSANKRADFSATASQTDGVPTGNVYWNDKKAKTIIQSTRITRIERTGNTAVIYGEATLNKNAITTFTLTLTDNGASGDTASMEAGTYTNSGTVQGGDVSVQ